MPKYTTSEQTPEQLVNLAASVNNSAEALRMAAEWMRQVGLTSVKTTNYDQMERATEYLEKFTAAVRIAIKRSLENRGDFGARDGVEAKPIPKARKKRGA